MIEEFHELLVTSLQSLQCHEKMRISCTARSASLAQFRDLLIQDRVPGDWNRSRHYQSVTVGLPSPHPHWNCPHGCQHANTFLHSTLFCPKAPRSEKEAFITLLKGPGMTTKSKRFAQRLANDRTHESDLDHGALRDLCGYVNCPEQPTDVLQDICSMRLEALRLLNRMRLIILRDTPPKDRRLKREQWTELLTTTRRANTAARNAVKSAASATTSSSTTSTTGIRERKRRSIGEATPTPKRTAVANPHRINAGNAGRVIDRNDAEHEQSDSNDQA